MSFTGLKQIGERYVKIVGLYDNCPALQLGMKLAKISTVLCNGLNRSYCHVVQRTSHIFGKNSYIIVFIFFLRFKNLGYKGRTLRIPVVTSGQESYWRYQFAPLRIVAKRAPLGANKKQ